MHTAAPCNMQLERPQCVAGHPQQQWRTITLYPPVTQPRAVPVCSAARVAVGSRARDQVELSNGFHFAESGRGKVQQRNQIAWRTPPAGPPVHPAELMRRIKACKSMADLQDVYQQWRAQMNYIHFSAMLNKVVKLSGLPHRPATAPGSHFNGAHPSSSTPGPLPRTPGGQPLQQQQQLMGSTVQGSAATPASYDMLLIRALLFHLAAEVRSLTNRQVANCMWAASKLGVVPSNAWASRMMNAARQTWHQANPQQVSNIVYALAVRSEWLDSIASRNGWLNEMFQVAYEHTDGFTPQELAGFMWGAARLHDSQQLPSTPAVINCLNRAFETALALSHEMNDVEVCNLLWATSKLCGQPGLAPCAIAPASRPPLLPAPSPDVLQALLDTAEARASMLRPHGLSTVLLSLGRLGGALPDGWCHHLLDSTMHLLPQCHCQELSNVLLGLAYLGHRPHTAWLQLWQQCAMSKASSFKSQELANMTWAVCRLQLPVTRELSARLLLASASSLHAFKPGELVMLILGLARNHTVPDECWMQLYAATAHEHLGSLSGPQISLILSSCARLGFQPPSHWLDAVCAHLQPQLQSMPASSLAMTVHAFATMGHPVSPAWSHVFCAACHARLGEANPQDVATMLWGAATLQMQPKQRWVQTCIGRCHQLVTAQVAAQGDVRQADEAYSSSDSAVLLSHSDEPQESVVQSVQGEGHRSSVSIDPDVPLLPRGGERHKRVSMVTGRSLWNVKLLDKVAWALGRLGCAGSPAAVELFRSAGALQLGDVDLSSRWQQYLHVKTGRPASTGPATGMPNEAVAPVNGHHATSAGAAGALPNDMSYLVLEGILNWSAAKLKAPGGQPQDVQHEQLDAVEASQDVLAVQHEVPPVAELVA